MFKKYNTGVGISIDGPFPCNELRGFGTRKQRKKQTRVVMDNLYKLYDEKIHPGVISVVHKYNGTGDRIEIMKDWIENLYKDKITGRLNPCCTWNY